MTYLGLASLALSFPLPLSSDLFEGLPARWEQAMADLHVPGLAVTIVLDDEVVLLEGWGERDVETHRPVTPDTAFYIASATKPFVAVALAALAESDALDLDLPVRTYLPRFELADPRAARAMTVRDLLCHAPGLNYGPIVLLDAYTGEITEDRYYHFLAQATPQGTTRYSNVHFTLAGRVLEAVTGQRWREALAQRIFEPAGMTATTGFADEMYAREDVAFPSVWSDGRFALATVRKNDDTMHAAGGLGTSARDAGRWLRLNLNRGVLDDEEFFSEATAADIFSLHSEEEGRPARLFPDRGFGLGWMVSGFRDHTVYQHGGGYVGTAALFSFLPELGIGVAALANSAEGGNALCTVVVRDVYERLLGEGEEDYLTPLVQRLRTRAEAVRAPTARPLPVELSLAPEAYAGDYVNEHYGTLHIHFEGERMGARLGRYAFEVLPAGVDRFEGEVVVFSGEFRFGIENGRARTITVPIRGQETLFAR